MSSSKTAIVGTAPSKPNTNIRLATTGLQFKCCAPGCLMNGETKITYSLHPFPNETTEPERHRIWKRLLLIDRPITRSDVICARHFPKQSFKQNADGTPQIFLQPDAYPYATSQLKLRMERHRANREKINAGYTKSRAGTAAKPPVQDIPGDDDSGSQTTVTTLDQDINVEVEIIDEVLLN